MPVFYRKLFVFLLSSIRNFQSAIHRPNTSSNTYRCGYLQIGRWQDHVLKLIGWTPLKERCNMALCHTHQDWSIPSFNCPECWQMSTFLIEELCLAKPRPFAGVGWGGVGGEGGASRNNDCLLFQNLQQEQQRRLLPPHSSTNPFPTESHCFIFFPGVGPKSTSNGLCSRISLPESALGPAWWATLSDLHFLCARLRSDP